MITRFAPSPTGPLHLGHAFAAIFAHDMARAAGGKFLVRFEDIDRQRSRESWIAAALEDLEWLGLMLDEPPVRQSERMHLQNAALDQLWSLGLLYPCYCRRRDIEQALTAPQEGATPGLDGLIYPGTCRPSHGFQAAPSSTRPRETHLRLDLNRAILHLGLTPEDPIACYVETGIGPDGRSGLIEVLGKALVDRAGDIVLQRRDFGTSYHLAVVVDDADQGITHVTRGADLSDVTMIHVLLQKLLGLSSPEYHHHLLIRDETGRRLAKRDDARALSRYRAEGVTPDMMRRMVGLDRL